jgi:hypothetical protein
MQSGWSTLDQPDCITLQLSAAGLIAKRVVSSSAQPGLILTAVQVHLTLNW